MLLDTHILLWFLEDSPKLPLNLKRMIEDSDHVFISIITLWEIAIKLTIGKLNLQFAFQELPDFLDSLEIEVLPLSFEDLNDYVNLPLHHKDPFDRILIAQAINRSLPLVSKDHEFDAYPIEKIWV
ncbi:MAG: type II toxin-antitoxin system VapC family toxin [Oscillatoriales cyanobacterium SM2_2_1]|nr:type II toxin-antitoxin system VapC family toxin [Oscillatoriales cyanobacterium SM2_2_1]